MSSMKQKKLTVRLVSEKFVFHICSFSKLFVKLVFKVFPKVNKSFIINVNRPWKEGLFMKKFIPYLIISFFIVIISFGLIVIFTGEEGRDSKILKEPTDNIKLISTSYNNNVIIEKYLLVLNDKEMDIEVKFNYEVNNNVGVIKGYINNNQVYSLEKKVTASNRDKIFNTSFIEEAFNTGNFKLIEGSDKNYLAVITNNNALYYNKDVDYLYIFTENLDLINNGIYSSAGCVAKGMTIQSGITEYSLENNAMPWYDDAFGACLNEENCHVSVRVKDSNIYYLMPVKIYNENREKYENFLEERLYKIKDNKLEYKVLKRYKVASSSGIYCED